MEAEGIHPIKVFYCYSHEDDALREQLARHLSPLRRLRDITGWFDGDIRGGAAWERETKERLDTANIILILVSADFMASDYQYTVEMTRALKRQQIGTAHVIPILLRPVEWENTPLGKLSPLPTNRIPVTQWANPDAAWLNVVQGIREIVRTLLPKQLPPLQDSDILYTEQGPLSGQTIGGKYLLGDLIGEGGFSQVYKAQHLLIQRQQAVKVLLERHFRKLEFRDRFLREARTIAALDHPNIIHLDDFWVEPSQAYLIMPYMSKGTLQDILEQRQGFLEQDQIVFYLEHICVALDYAHKQGVVHLDLKPLNLLVHENGRLLLSDFGLAHLMKDGAIAGGSSLGIGTPHYMAPEHIKGSPERRSDLFSLGVMLYQMLLGRLPFGGLPPEAVLIKNMTEWPIAPQVLRPELLPTVEGMLRKALAKQPEQRYQTANELLVAFKQALAAPVMPPIVSNHYGPPVSPIIEPPTRFSQNRRLRLDVAQRTDVGRKCEHNEDNMAYVIPKDPQVIARKGVLLIVAGGMSGHEKGEVASEIAVNTVCNAYYQDDNGDVPNSLLQSIRQANAAIRQRAAENMLSRGMGTTCVAAVLRGNLAYIANVGHCRAYFVRKSRIYQISQDHSWVAEQVHAGLLTEEQARTHTQRNAITRCLGTQPDVEIDIFREVLEEGDVVVLCSNGLWEMVNNEGLLRIVDQFAPQESVKRLMDRAIENGGPDNITVIVARIQEVNSEKIALANP